MIGIYKIVNKVTKQNYVGSSINIKARFNTHHYLLTKGKSHSPRLQNAWDKYGGDAFSFEVLEICEKVELTERELFWVRVLDCVNNGYNCSENVEVPTRGFKHSDETRKRMSQAQKNLTRTPEMLQKSANQLIAYNLSLRGMPKSQSHKDAIGKGNKGKKLSPEHISILRNRVISEETRAKHRGRIVSEETRAKMRIANLRTPGNRCRPIAQFDLNNLFISNFISTTEAAKLTGVGRTNIKNCLRGFSKTAGRFIWKYV